MPEIVDGLEQDAVLELLTLTPNVQDEYFHCIAYKASNDHPGIVFDSCRDGYLVKISRVFAQGPADGSGLLRDDVVLTIQQQPITRPEQAAQLLRDLIRDDKEELIFFYVFRTRDYLKSMCDKVIKEKVAKDKRHNPHGNIEGSGLRPHLVRNRREIDLIVKNTVKGYAAVDRNSLQLMDDSVFTQRYTVTGGEFACVSSKASHQDIIRPFFRDANIHIHKTFSMLEECVAIHAHKHALGVDDEAKHESVDEDLIDLFQEPSMDLLEL